MFKQKVPHLYQLSDHSSLEIERVNIIPEETSPLQSNSILCKRNYNEADDDTEKQKEKRLKTHNDETCLLQRNSIICKRNYNDPNDDYEEQKRKKLKTQT